MMKTNRIIAGAKRTAVYALIPVMVFACKSRERKISELSDEISQTSSRIEQTYNMRAQDITDSVSKNQMYSLLNEWINEDTQHIDSLRTRNRALEDSIRTRKVNRVAKQYPLSAFLPQQEIRQISAQLKEFCSEWNKKSALNIIAGRGTLQDLYNVCFDLDFTLFEPSFYILNDDGSIRFTNPHLNEICEQFEAEKHALEQEEILNAMRRRANQKEFIRNKKEIGEFERKCNISDSLYMAIERHFVNQYAPRLDSLNRQVQILQAQRDQLIQERAINAYK